MKAKDLTGAKFGRVVVCKFSHINANKKRCYVCKCDCGKEFWSVGASLISGNTKSCGCFKVEQIKKSNTLHGGCIGARNGWLGFYSSEYKVWQGMKNRCTNPNNKNYKHYGGRGIVVCERWENSFENFINDMGPRPKGKYTIERINNNIGYEPGNCVWEKMKVQANNKRTNVLLTYQNQTLNVSQWAEKLGIRPGTLFQRILRKKTIDKILKPLKNGLR